MERVQLVGIATAFISALFWIIGAGIRIPPIRFWRIGLTDPTTTALRRQSLMNAFAAIFAAIAAICQGIATYALPD
jgi:hypothetical protein